MYVYTKFNKTNLFTGKIAKIENFTKIFLLAVKITTESIYIFLLLTDRKGIYDSLRKALRRRFFFQNIFVFSTFQTTIFL